MKKHPLIFVLLLLQTIFLFYCSKPTSPNLSNPYDVESDAYIPGPDLNTSVLLGLTAVSATSGGSFRSDYGKPITQKGVCWSTSENPTIDDSCYYNGEGLGAYVSILSDLEPDTQYYLRAFAINEDVTIYGNQRSFTTLDGVPSVTTIEPNNIGKRVMFTGGIVNDNGGSEITEKGICYAMGSNVPGINDTCIISDSNSNNFQIKVENLSIMQVYSVSAYAKNDITVSWGEIYEFETVFWPTDNETEVVDVFNANTGRIWMDRNLGSTRVATFSTDVEAGGDLYQWGRAADGHQKRNSTVTSTLSNSDQPGHGWFILSPNSPFDWRRNQNNNFWQGLDGINNPCPEGYRIPTEAEWNQERLSWSTTNSNGAFNSPLKLVVSGFRTRSGQLSNVGFIGKYWSSTISGIRVRHLDFFSGNARILDYERGSGMSVRCIQD